ncbi:MAG: Asp-tRNA(Asn)/Glu-tRNA(Gln) amidotransferase subunit GatB [Planctomycetaceae bacterium]|nr:Asp-tRNA(Asn)/Glu-tRNA(Gln) amidotransferase subunit GatB [Planctomycetaceae bacterium]
MDYSIIIGLEVHVQLLTKSKIFCGCANLFNPDNPNVQTCPVCIGMPGSLPVMNQEAFRLAVKTALSLNLEIPSFTKWDRKQYYYPDLPKGYQISQYDLPFSQNGWLDIGVDEKTGEPRRIRIIRAHLEEDAGKNMHDESGRGTDSQVDLNRAGTPLLEIVSHPDLRSAAEAKRYLEELRILLTYLEVSDCNMQEGSLRCDANVNLHIHQDGQKIATPIVEIKNLNSFRNVELAIEYEAARQYEEWKAHGKKFGEVAKETRGYDAARNTTFAQRGKEEASDYRYFPDPDLVPVEVSPEFLSGIRESLCEFPAARRARYQSEHGLSEYDASVLIDQGRNLADYFDVVATGCGDGKQACNWITQDILREMNNRKLNIDQFPIRPDVLVDILKKVNGKKITIKSGREVFMDLLDNVEPADVSVAKVDAIIEQKGLALVADSGQLEGIVKGVVERNPKAVADFKGGKQAAVGALIGQVMREMKGADAAAVRELILKVLQG